MSLGQLLILHVMAGVGVAGAVYLATANQRASLRWFQVLTALFFWPMYLPLLLQTPLRSGRNAPCKHADLDGAIAQVGDELDAALANLEGRCGDAFAPRQGRLHALRGIWAQQAGRIREIERLLKQMTLAHSAVTLAPRGDVGDDRVRDSRQGLAANIRKLEESKEEQLADLRGSLAAARELVSLIHLVVYSGNSGDAAERQMAELVAAADAISVRGQEADAFRSGLQAAFREKSA